MKKIIRYSIIMSFIAVACNNETTPAREITSDSSIVQNNTQFLADSVLSGCYSLIANRDTASLQLIAKGASVTGSLSYNLFQKDHNDGTIEGEVHNDMVIGWYLFRSEGIMSVRQVAWKIGSDATLWPALGDVTVRNDTARFVNTDRLSFDSSRRFIKVKCEI